VAVAAVNCCVPPGTCTVALVGETVRLRLGLDSVLNQFEQPQQTVTISAQKRIERREKK